jgi:hypothetical protein
VEVSELCRRTSDSQLKRRKTRTHLSDTERPNLRSLSRRRVLLNIDLLEDCKEKEESQRKLKEEKVKRRGRTEVIPRRVELLRLRTRPVRALVVNGTYGREKNGISASVDEENSIVSSSGKSIPTHHRFSTSRASL